MIEKRNKRLWRFGRPENPFSPCEESWDFLMKPPKDLAFSFKVFVRSTNRKEGKKGVRFVVSFRNSKSNKTNGQIGLEFERRVKASFVNVMDKCPNFILFKIPDTRGERAKIGRNDIYTDKVPADFILITPHSTAFIECKSTNDMSGFRLKMIRPFQLQKAVEMHNIGHKSYFFIEHRKPSGGTLYIVDGYKIVEANKKTISWSFLKTELSDFIIDREGGLYDLSSFIENVY